MAILSHEYWKKFIEKDKNGKERGMDASLKN